MIAFFLSLLHHKAAPFCVLALACVSAGAWVSCTISEAQRAERQRILAEQTAAAEAQLREHEHEIAQTAGRIDGTRAEQDAAIYARFDSLIQGLDDDVADFSGLIGGLSEPAAGTGDLQMPDPAATPGGLSARPCECSRADATRINRLQKELKRLELRLYTIARDCDITATHYNSLLQLYHEAEKAAK